MGKVLHGFDVASYQLSLIGKNNNWISTYPDFVICKATEGTNYKFLQAETILNTAKKNGKQIGVYHYCRADKGNSPILEAKFFIENVMKYGDAIYALDVEDKSLLVPDIDNWARMWCDAVYSVTKRRPLLYVSQSACKKFPNTCAGNYGLWVAHYDVAKVGDIAPWKFWALWQYHVNKGQNIDENFFNGTEEQFKAYAKKV